MVIQNESKKVSGIKIGLDFFTRESTKKIRELPGGNDFVILYLRLLTIAVKGNGYVYYDGIGSTPVEELAAILHEDKKKVDYTIEWLRRANLVEERENGDYFFPEALEMVYTY